ncbi:kinesin-like protein KIF15 isoform X2 [Lepisosteus oculatus]|uniref:kinesin-like protein KIF15 isoform X2 n=1 Tax=Lepisosteus oculatus TaxID=7918 RepID=UPI0035F50BC3
MGTGIKGDSGDAAHLSGDGDAIKVFVRVRPLTQGTGLSTDGDPSLCLTVTSPNTIRLHSKPEPRVFTYDHVADMDVSQEAVFSSVGKNIVESCVNGYNGTIFAYGQTGSGKTFTMLGPAESDNFTHDMRGVIPRSFEYLFFLINREAEKSSNGKSFLCKCSFIEIYNEQIFDLLDSASASLFLRENIKKGVFVDGAVEKIITSAGEAYQVLSTGWRNRRVASTSMNRESSRSHAVFTVTLESKETVNEIVNIRSSQLNLVDLAGSERQKDTHAEGTRLKEAGSINRSLSCLGHVIMALVDVSNGKSRHICYRDSKLTFLLRDSLGGNARTFIIANVHPGSKCFGETLSTLHFAQRAKLIKNKAVINEDTQGNVRQLQAEVKKLKEQLAQALAAQTPAGARGGPDHEGHSVPADPVENGVSENEHKHRFLEAMLLWEKSESEKKNLLQKVTQLEETWAKKEKFIQSNRMILKFREDHISRLEKSLKESQGGLSSQESEAAVSQLKQEIQILREQVEQHPRVAKYAVENHSLREENQRLRSLEPVKRAQELSAQVAAELEKAFREASAAEKLPGVPPLFSTPVAAENVSSVSVERLRAQLMQKQAELTTTVQAYEEYKELTKKRLLEMESEKQYLEKANQHLENILEATQAHTRQEVSQLNKKHFETIKNLTTPTRGYCLRSRLVPHFSPDHSMDLSARSLPAEDPVDDILNEPVPPEMNELACEALTEELETVQEQVSALQLKLDEEEVKNRKLLQQIGKLEEHSNKMEELLSSERSNWSKEQQNLQDHISSLEKDLREEKTRTDVLRSEVHDLRLVLHSADRELLAAKAEYSSYRGAQELELSQLSSGLIHVQLQLDTVRLEHEKLLEERRSLQDSHDTLQEVMKYESEEHKQRVAESQRENAALQAELSKLLESMKTEKERNSNLTSQLKEDKETTSKELLRALDENVDLKKHISSLTVQSEQQTAELHSLKQSLTAANTSVAELEKKCETEKEFVVDILNQTQELRNTLNEKNEMLAVLSSELEDIKEKYCAALAAREESRALIARHEKEVIDLREAMERRVSSDKIEQELLQEDLSHAAEEVEKLTKVVNEQTALLQAAQAAAAGYTAVIQELQEQLKQKNELKSPKITSEQNHKAVLPATPLAQTQTPKTPSSFSTDLTKVLEAQEQELENRRSSIVTLEMLVKEFSAERLAQNEEILRLKAQLCEKENLRLELTDQCYTLQNQMAQNCGSVEKDGNSHEAVMKELKEERKARVAAMTKLSELEVDLQRTSATLSSAETCIQQMTSELRDRSIELKELREKDLDHEKLAKEVDVLRKQVDFLAEENGKLVGHQNLNQKIQYLVKLKKENTKLIEDNEKLRLENFNLKESCKKIQVST